MNILKKINSLFYSAVISDSVILFPSAGREGDMAENDQGVIYVTEADSMPSLCETFIKKSMFSGDSEGS